jgi:DNA topoisomerase-2
VQLEKLSNQARFVQMIIKKELVVSNRKKADIVAELRKKDFKPFPKVSKAKAAGETEAVVEEDDDDDDAEVEAGKNAIANDYDYLLGMAIWSLTQEKVRRYGVSIF